MDVRGNIVKLSDGTQISYDKCLIATGMLLIFFLFVLCLVPGFLFQWHLSDKVSAVCVKHLAEQSRERQSYRQPCHWVFPLASCQPASLGCSRFCSVKISREGGKGDCPSSSVKELLYRPASSNPACSSSRQNNQLLLGQSTAPASNPIAIYRESGTGCLQSVERGV